MEILIRRCLKSKLASASKKRNCLATGAGADIGKLVKLAATTEAQAYGIVLDPVIDTGAAFSDGSVTGSIAKSGTFRGLGSVIVPLRASMLA